MTATVQGWLMLWGAVVVLLIAAAIMVELQGSRTMSGADGSHRFRRWFGRRPSPEAHLPQRLVALQRVLPADRRRGSRHHDGRLLARRRAVRNLRLVRRPPAASSIQR